MGLSGLGKVTGSTMTFTIEQGGGSERNNKTCNEITKGQSNQFDCPF